MARIAYWGKQNEASERPMNASSRSSAERSEQRILGDLGVMAVQFFSRIRVNIDVARL